MATLIVVGSLAVDAAGIGAVVALFVLVVPFERTFPRHRGQSVRRQQVGTDIAYALSAPALNVVGLIVAIIVGVLTLAWVPGLAIRPVVMALPPTAQLIVGVLLFDLAVYWVHRWSHEVSFFWRFHKIHHSTEHLDWISGFRVHPFDGAVLAPPFAFLLAAGFSAQLTGVLALVQILAGLFLHANVRWRLRPLHRVIATPDFHHWHHSNELDARNRNYAGLLPIWDLVFGTYFMPRHRRSERYGVDEYVPHGMVPQLLAPLKGIGPIVWHPVRLARQLARDIRRSTGRPTRA